jgi:hypothetical protein
MAELLREYGGTECGTLRLGGIGAGGDFLALWAERKYEGYFR